MDLMILVATNFVSVDHFVLMAMVVELVVNFLVHGDQDIDSGNDGNMAKVILDTILSWNIVVLPVRSVHDSFQLKLIINHFLSILYLF